MLKIDTLGCCVLRDVFRIGDVEEKRVQLNKNIGFISPMSMFSKSITISSDISDELLGGNLEAKECYKKSLGEIIDTEFEKGGIAGFIRRNCFLDLSKNIFHYLHTKENTYLFMDLSDLRFRILVKDDFSVTIREDWWDEVKIIRPLLEKEGFVIKRFEDFSEKDVFNALDNLASSLLKLYSSEQIFLLYTTPTPLYINKCGEYVDDSEFLHLKYQDCRPRELEKYNNYFINICHCNVINFPVKHELLANANHTYGLFSLHYIDEVYKYYYWELINKKIEKNVNFINPYLHEIENILETARSRNNYSDKLPTDLLKSVCRDDFCEYVNSLAKAYSSLIVLCVKDTIGYFVSESMNAALHSLGLCVDFQNLHQLGYIAIISNGIVVDEIIGTEECKSVCYSGTFAGNTLKIESMPFENGNLASIIWNEHDFAVNKRGLNFFVYDYHTNRVCDARCYDTHSKECILTPSDDFLDNNTALLISMEKVLELCIQNKIIGTKGYDLWRSKEKNSMLLVKENHSFRNISDFIKYLDALSGLKKYIIIIAAKDTIGFNVGKDGYDAFKKLGLKKLGDGKDNLFCHWKGYAAVLSEGKVLYEELSEVDGCVNFRQTIGKNLLDIFSGSLHAGNTASILINGEEYAVNERGFNIVVVSPVNGAVLDSIAFDTHAKERSGTRSGSYNQERILPKTPDTMLIRNLSEVRERLKLENLLPEQVTEKATYQMADFPVKIKVRVFFWGAYNLWSAMQSVVEAFKKDDRFELLIVCETNDIDTLVCVRQYGLYIQHVKYNIQTDEPDIIIYNWANFFENSNSAKLRVYIPSVMIDGSERDTQQLIEFCQKKLRDEMKADVCFCEKNLYKRFLGIDTGAKWVVSGNPKLDLIYEKTKFPPQMPSSWKKLKDKKVILWAFDHNWNTTGVTFDLYAQAFFKYFSECRELGLIIRPHLCYPRELVSQRIWTVQDLQSLKQYCENTPNIIWDDSFDYGLAYSMADAVITDINCGITISALPLEVPIAVLQRFDGYPGVPQYPDVMKAMYQITGLEELFAFFEMILRGEDTLKESRQAIKEEYIANFDGKNGQRIKEKIVEMYNERVKESEQNNNVT